jgi:hypothetical protein
MRKAKITLLALAFLANILLFQNCSDSSFGSLASDDSAKTKAGEPDSTGQPYDGKIFISSGFCPDGTFVQARIVLNSLKSATLVRENCRETSRDLVAGDFSVDPANSSQILYGNLTLKKETPWISVPIFSSWYLQLQGTLQTHNSLVYDIDLFDYSASQIQSLKQAGHIVICNFSSGTYENWRSDANSFSSNDLGNNVSSGPSERWLDIRSASVHSIMLSRLDLAQTKGCDGVDLDSADGYANNTGFPLSSADQISYNQSLAFAAHDRHLIAALKNNADLASSVVDVYDLAIAEQCFQYNECDKFSPFTNQGKAILEAEYTAPSSAQCSSAQSSSLSLIFLSRALDGTSYQACP